MNEMVATILDRLSFNSIPVRPCAFCALRTNCEPRNVSPDIEAVKIALVSGYTRFSADNVPTGRPSDLAGFFGTVAIPGIVDLSELVAEADGVAKVVLESIQGMLLRLALQMAREDWETRRGRQTRGIALARKVEGKYPGRKADAVTHERIILLRGAGHTIAKTAKLAGCSTAQVKRIWAEHKAATVIA